MIRVEVRQKVHVAGRRAAGEAVDDVASILNAFEGLETTTTSAASAASKP